MPPPSTKVAFVSGVNGISGNAIVEHLIRLPKTEWSRIIITSRRPLQNYWQDPRVEFVTINFLEPVENIILKIHDICRDTTHAFYTSYAHADDFNALADLNVPLFQNFLTAIDTVSVDLQRVCLQTGGKHYGVHLRPGEVPLHEGLPRYDDKGSNFYYPQENFLFSLSARRGWSYNIIRPNAIIGFTPSGNGMSQALTIALYFLICRELGEDPTFPGNDFFYNCVDDSSYAPSIADMSVWAVTEEHTRNEAFNHTNGDTFVWRYFWPKLGQYFGVETSSNQQVVAQGDLAGPASSVPMIEWAKDKKMVWHVVCEKYGGNKEAFDWGTWFFLDWTLGKGWPTIGTASKARKYGWKRYDDTYETWTETFRSFENAGVLPSSRALKQSEVALSTP